MKAYRLHVVAGILVLVDQITKLAVKGFSVFGITHEGMSIGQSIPLIGDFVRLTYVENAGSAFGLEWGSAKIILTLATVLISAGLFWYLARLHDAPMLTRISVMLLLAGALGNLIDRTFYGVAYGQAGFLLGSVVDFIQVDIPDVDVFGVQWTHWPVFNVADSCVSVGIVLLLLTGGKTNTTAKKNEQAVDVGNLPLQQTAFLHVPAAHVIANTGDTAPSDNSSEMHSPEQHRGTSVGAHEMEPSSELGSDSDTSASTTDSDTGGYTGADSDAGGVGGGTD